jgi:hypothetical protein
MCHVDSSVRPLVGGANEFTIGAGSLSAIGSSPGRSLRADSAEAAELLPGLRAVLVGRGGGS